MSIFTPANTKRIGLYALLGIVLSACEPTATVATSAAPEAEAPAVTGDLIEATPESVGMNSARLNRVTERMQELVDAGQLAGVVTMAARHSKIVHTSAVGYRDLDAGDPMSEDDIFRIYSMSKPITGVAMMILYEEGKFRLSDPVEKYIPEFKGLRVATGVDDDGTILTEPASHPMTIRELMSHTGGLTYGVFSPSAVDDRYNELDMLNPDQTLQEFIDKLASVPLRQQPGTLWHYSVSVDVQGYLVEKLSGQKFSDFLEERIFEPLGMKDTDFYVPPEKADRLAQVYGYGEDGKLIPEEGFGGANNYLENQAFESGGGGLVGTAMDYLRFSQMLLNGGELDGVRILAPLTVELMHRNQMPESMGNGVLGAGGTSFGLDFAIIEDPVEAESYSKGEYYWGGAAGTWFWVDPVEDIVFVGMIQAFGGANGQVPNVRAASRQAVYQSLMGVHQLQ